VKPHTHTHTHTHTTVGWKALADGFEHVCENRTKKRQKHNLLFGVSCSSLPSEVLGCPLLRRHPSKTTIIGIYRFRCLPITTLRPPSSFLHVGRNVKAPGWFLTDTFFQHSRSTLKFFSRTLKPHLTVFIKGRS